MTPKDNPTAASDRLAPFLIENRDALRHKIESLEGLWRRRWEQFCERARLETRTVRWYGGAPDVPLHAAFAFLATGSDEMRAIARRDLRWLRDNYAATLQVGAQEFDTWIYAAPMARRAIALDWMWDSFDADERAELAELFIADALKYPYVVLHHRVPPHSNNQGLAMALNLVVVGFLFGVRRGHDGRARHLLEWGLEHLHQQIALLPPGGYGGEGSTYEVLIAAPLLALSCAVLEAISGEDYFARPLGQNGNAIGPMLELSAKIIPPSDILPPWDQHGFQLGKAASVLAYLAHRHRDASWFANVAAGEGWNRSGSMAWLRDDHVWAWLWMPAGSSPRAQLPYFSRPWMENRVGGTLLDAAGTRHLFQMWDACTSPPVRLQMNPNHLQLEAWGSLLTVDGNPTEDFPLQQDPRLSWVNRSKAKASPGSWAGGSLAAHSVVIVDDAIDLHPEVLGYEAQNSITGWGLRHEIEENLQLITAEAAPFYRPFDIVSMRRTSALAHDSFWVILDEIEAQTPHEFTWQLVLRSGAALTPQGARLETAEGVVLDVVPADASPSPSELRDVPGFPSVLERRCHHFRRSQTGREVEFLTVLVPQLARREVANWSRGWTGRFDPQQRGLDEKWFDSSEEWPALELEDLQFRTRAPRQNNEGDASAVWFRRRVAVPPHDGERLLLELPRGYAMQLWVDGAEIPVPFLKEHHHYEPRLQAPFVDVTQALAGRSDAQIVLRLGREGTYAVCGECRLHAGAAVEAVRVERNGSTLFVHIGATRHELSLHRLHATPGDCAAPALRAGENAEDAARRAFRRAAPQGRKTEFLEWHGDAAARQRACVVAVHQPLEDVEGPLLARLGDEDWLVRMLAIRALGVLKCLAAAPQLRELLGAETAERVADPSYAARYRLKEMLILALHRLRDAQSVPLLMACLNPDEFIGVRRLAAVALGDVGDASAIPSLSPWTDDGDAETAGACRRAMEKLENRGV